MDALKYFLSKIKDLFSLRQLPHEGNIKILNNECAEMKSTLTRCWFGHFYSAVGLKYSLIILIFFLRQRICLFALRNIFFAESRICALILPYNKRLISYTHSLYFINMLYILSIFSQNASDGLKIVVYYLAFAH